MRYKTWIQRGWLSALLLCLWAAGWAQNPVVVSANLSERSITVGDTVFLRIQVHGAQGTRVQPLNLKPLERVSNLEVLQAGQWDTLHHAGALVHQQRIQLTAWDSGYYQLPALEVAYLDLTGVPGTSESKPIDLQVRLLSEDSEPIRPIHGIVEEPLTLEDFLPFLGGLAMLLLLAGLVWYFWRRRQVADKQAQEEPSLPPYELAVQRLRKLREQQLWQRGEVNSYYSELSYILRAYLEARFAFPALESSTSDILRESRKQRWESGMEARVLHVLQTADLVKFAKAEPGAEEHERCLLEAEEFVERTRPVLPETDEEKEVST